VYKINLLSQMQGLALLVVLASQPSMARDLAREPAEHPLYRSGKCFSISQQQQLELPADSPKNYEIYRQIKKVDVACVADDIRVDQPLHTWGGDLVMFATRIEVNAPIDVRPYFVQSMPFDRYQGSYRGWRDAWLQPPRFGVWNRPASIQAYQRMSDEHYSACQGCITVGQEVIGPQFPPGLTAANISGVGYSDEDYRNNLKPGLAPLQIVSASTARSGSVTLIAREIVFANHLTGTFAPQEVCDKSGGDTFAINASGVRGGRGGMGAVASCAGFRPSGRFRCADYLYQNRSPSGPGGDGGDGGEVSIVRLDSAIDEPFRTRIGTSTTAAGGLPGPRSLFILPQATSGGWGELPYVPMCQRASGGQAPAARSGRDGTVTFTSARGADGLALLYKILTARHARADYLFDELAKRSIESKFLFTDSHVSFFDRAIAEAVLHGYARIAAEIHSGITGSLGSLPFDRWQSLAGVTPEAVSAQVAIAPSTYQVLKDWPLVDGSSGLGSAQFFLRSGGFLNVDDEQAFRRFLAEAARVDLGKQLELTAEQLGELTRIKGFVAESMLFNREVSIRERLTRLQSALAELEQSLANAPTGGLEGLAKSIGDARGPIAALYAALTPGDLSAIIGALGPASTAMGRIYGAMHTAEPDASGVPALKAAIAATTKELEDFLRAATQIRSQNTRSEEYAAFRALRERGALRSKLNGRIAMMPDLLKLSLLTYAADPASSRQTLASNAQAVWTFARRFPDEEPVFRLRPGPNSCGLLSTWDFGRNKGRCGVLIDPEPQTVFLITGDAFLDGLPALVVGGNVVRSVVFDTLGYGFKSSAIGKQPPSESQVKLRQGDQ
jgi:hypothetical protein